MQNANMCENVGHCVHLQAWCVSVGPLAPRRRCVPFFPQESTIIYQNLYLARKRFGNRLVHAFAEIKFI